MKQFSSDIRYVEATPRKQRKKSGAYSVISAGVSSSANNSALKSYVDSNFMSLATGQDVSALHNFLNGFNLAGIPFRKMANGSLFIDANVVFGGGATMYGTDKTPAPSIFDGLPIDGRTIKRDGNGALYVDETALSVSGGGGVADSVAWVNVTGKPTWITNTKPTYNYSEIQGTPDLSVYALASSLANYALKASIPTNNNQLTNGAGYITSSALNGYATQTFVNTAVNGAKEWVEEQQYLTEITSGMIESVLGYQPYDGDTNRLGFLTSSALNGYATQSWVNTALAGYLPLSGGTVKGNLLIDRNPSCIQFLKSGISVGFLGIASDLTPIVYNAAGNTAYNILHAGNYSNYALPIKGGMIYGNGADLLGVNRIDGNPAIVFYHNNTTMGRLGFDTSGDAVAQVGGEYKKILHSGNIQSFNAGSATKLATPRTIWGQSFDGTGNVTGDMSGVGKFSASDNGYLTDIANGDITISIPATVTGGWARGLSYKHLSNENSFGQLAGAYGVGSTLGYFYYGGNSGTHAMRLYGSANEYAAMFAGNVTAPTFTGNLTGNASSATKLQTPRTIWGQSFDGTGNVSGTFNNILNAYRGSSAVAYLHITNVSTAVDYVSMYVSNLDNSRTDRPLVLQNGYGNVAIGGPTANAKLHVYGNLLTEGGITMYSQRSLKNILSYEGLSLEQLSVIKPIKFTWKDGRDNRYHVGGVADDVATVVPEVVYSANDFLTMDYGNAGFYVAASLIKPVIYCYNKVEKHEKDVDYLKRENVAIKNENKALRDEINQLKQAS